ncbi:outer membrane beta-barrel family protein [Larkinella ripae]
MKTVFTSLLLFFLFHPAVGQVSGLLNTASGQPIPFANVLLLNSSDSSLVKGTLTEDSGQFRLETVVPGTYRLRVSSLGFQTWHSPVFELTATQPVKDFGTQRLMDDSHQLGEVVVRAQKPLYEPTAEGTVVNVESSILSKGSSALQILERSPGVVIDYQNGGINLNGKTGVTILLNGKSVRMPIEQVVALLNGLSANEIDKIELLTTPGARYDAEGSAGIINLVLKKNTREGTNGSVSLTGGYGWGEKGTASLNLAHNRQAISLYGSYAYLHDRTYSDMAIDSWQNMPVLGGNLHVLATDTTKATQNNHDVTVGLDVRAGDKTRLGGSVNWNRSTRASTDFNEANYRILPDSVLFFRGTINGANRWQNAIGSLFVERKMRAGEQLTGTFDYLFFWNRSPTEVRSNFVAENGAQAGNNDSLFAPRQRGFANTRLRVGVAKLDYVRQLSKTIKLEAGLKGTRTQNGSSAGIESLIDGDWVSRTETANEIAMHESIGAVYASVTSPVNPKTNLVVGLRYEYSRTRMNTPQTAETVVDRKLGALFPSVFLSSKLGEFSELQFSYTKRLSRPSYTDLASFVRYSDPSAVYTGNPFLKPSLTNTVKLGFTYRNYNFSVLLSRDDHPIARHQLTEGPARNLLYISPQNLAWQNSLTVQLTLPVKVTGWWEMSYGFSGGPRQFRAVHLPQPVQKTYLGYSATLNQSFKLPRRFSAEVSGWFNSASYNGTTRVDAVGAVNAGIKKELKNNGGTLQLAVTDLLQTMRIHIRYGTLTQEAFSIKNHVRIDTESRVFPILKLTYTRSFGSTTLKPQSRQDGGSQEERNRIQKN